MVVFAAGALLGAATFTNYLAAFVACAALLHTVIARSSDAEFYIWMGIAASLRSLRKP